MSTARPRIARDILLRRESSACSTSSSSEGWPTADERNKGPFSAFGYKGRRGDAAMVKPYYVAGEWRTGERSFEVTSPYDGSVVERIGVPSDDDVEAAVTETTRMEHLPLHVRAEALAHVSAGIRDRASGLAELIAREGGKPLKWSRVEVDRAVTT